MSQLELLNLPKDTFEGGIECNDCKIVQDPKNFQHVVGTLGFTEIKRKCKSCLRDHYYLMKQLRSIHPYPDKNYECPICERNLKEISRTGQKRLKQWVLDHDHDTLLFRGWLCGNCNTGIGGLKDDIGRVKRALEYLQKHEEIL